MDMHSTTGGRESVRILTEAQGRMASLASSARNLEEAMQKAIVEGGGTIDAGWAQEMLQEALAVTHAISRNNGVMIVRVDLDKFPKT